MKSLLILFLLFCLNVYSKESITLWHAYSGSERKTIETLSKEYEKEFNVKINLLAIPFDAFDKKLTASIPRGQGPDVFIYANDNIGKWVESDFLEPIDYWMNGVILGTLIKTTVNAMTYNNNLYALPLAFKVPVLFYNKKFIQTPPSTFDELIEISKTKMSENKDLFGLAYDNTNLFFHSMFLYGFNGEIFGEGKKVLIAEQNGVDALEFVKKLSIDANIMPKSIDSALITTLFNQDKLLFVINGPWFMGDISNKVDYEIATIPMLSTDKTAKPFMSIEGILLNKYSKNKVNSIRFMKYLIKKESAVERMIKGKQSVATLTAYENDEVKTNNKLIVFQKQAENATPLSNNPIMSYFWNPMGQALKKVINQKYEPSKALKESKEELEKLLSK